MKLDHSKGVVDDHEDNFAIVFAAMGVCGLWLASCASHLCPSAGEHGNSTLLQAGL